LDISAGGHVMPSQESPFTFMGQNRTSITVILHGMPVMQPGILRFKFSVGDVEATYDIPMEQAQSQQMQLFPQPVSGRLTEIAGQPITHPEAEPRSVI
jgi:hypothetical protein